MPVKTSPAICLFVPACPEGQNKCACDAAETANLLHDAAHEQKHSPPYPGWHVPAPLRRLGFTIPLPVWCCLVSASARCYSAFYGPSSKGQAMTDPKPRPKPSRVSVPLSREALDAFEALAKVQNLSTGKAISEWLEETIDAVLYLSKLLEEARAAPKLVAQKMHAFALGLADESGALVEQIRKESKKGPGDA